MNISQILEATQGGQGLVKQAKQLGLDQDQLSGTLTAFIPALSQTFQTKAKQDGLNLADLINGFGGKQAAELVDKQDLTPELGQSVLDQLLDTDKQASLTSSLANQTSAPSDGIAKLLPLITGLFTGTLAQAESGDLDVGQLLGGGMMGSMASMAFGMMGGGEDGGMIAKILEMVDQESDTNLISKLLG